MIDGIKNSQAVHRMHGWGNGYHEKVNGATACLSVVFSWDLEKAIRRSAELRAEGYSVKVGGPAAVYAGVSNGDHPGAVDWHNPNATRTSTGCPLSCDFCIVPQVEGDIVEKEHWEVRPILYDNNLTACSRRHFDRVVDSLKFVAGVDLNQGVSAALLTKHHASRLAELDIKCVRLAWDSVSYESLFMRGFELLRKAGIPKSKIGVYVLIGFEDTPEDALYRLESVKSLGVLPFPMRYQSLDAVKRNSYVGDNWTHQELVRYCRYWTNLRFVRGIPFKDFRYPPPKKVACAGG